MKKEGMLIFGVVFIVILLVFNLPLASSEESISNCQELQDINNDLSEEYYLEENIDCSETKDWNDGEGFEPIGDGDSHFSGVFDGRGHTISNLYIDRHSYVGLFGSMKGGAIYNIHLRGVDIQGVGDIGEKGVGTLVGTNFEGIIENSSATGSLYVEGGGAGGLVGIKREGDVRIINSYSDVNIEGSDAGRVGGLVGIARGRGDKSLIKSSYSKGDIEIDVIDEDGGSNIGGLVGYCGDCTISNSYSFNYVEGKDKVGGLVGWVVGNGAVVSNSYSVGNVEGSSEIGGLIGKRGFTDTLFIEVKNSFWDKDVFEGESDGGEGKITREMNNIETFSEEWDIKISEEDLNEGYPFPGWQLDGSPEWYIHGKSEYVVGYNEENSLEDVEISIYDDEDREDLINIIYTGENGQAEIYLKDGIYYYMARKDEYKDYIDQFKVDGKSKIVDFEMGKYTIVFSEENELEGVKIKIYKDEAMEEKIEEAVTDKNGEVPVNLGKGTYYYMARKDEYSYTGKVEEILFRYDWPISFDITEQEKKNVLFNETGKLYDVSIKIYDDEDKEDLVDELKTDEDGQDTITLEDGIYYYMARKDEYKDYIDQFKVDGESKIISFEIREEDEVDEGNIGLEIVKEGRGHTSPSQGTHLYNYGEEVEVTASSFEEWEFVRWEGDCEGKDCDLIMTDDKKVVAVFEESGSFFLIFLVLIGTMGILITFAFIIFFLYKINKESPEKVDNN